MCACEGEELTRSRLALQRSQAQPTGPRHDTKGTRPSQHRRARLTRTQDPADVCIDTQLLSLSAAALGGARQGNTPSGILITPQYDYFPCWPARPGTHPSIHVREIYGRHTHQRIDVVHKRSARARARTCTHARTFVPGAVPAWGLAPHQRKHGTGARDG